MPWRHAIVDLGWMHVDADHLRNLPSAIRAPGTRLARAAVLAQAYDELTAQFAAGMGVDRGVDRFVGHVALRLFRKHALERSGDLLRATTSSSASSAQQTT